MNTFFAFFLFLPNLIHFVSKKIQYASAANYIRRETKWVNRCIYSNTVKYISL